MVSGAGRWWLHAAAVALIAVQLPGLLKTAADPSQSDFANYFVPAVVLARGGAVGGLYDRDTFDRALAEAGLPGLGSFIPHPPANALWLLPLAALSPGVAKTLWTSVLLVALGLCAATVGRLSPGFERPLAMVLVLAPTLAIRNSLAFGQPYPVLAALILVGVLALERRRDFLAGVLLGLGVSFKPYALATGLLFLDRGRRRAFLGFALGALVPSLLLWSLTGVDPFVEFVSKVLPWMVRGDIQDPFSPTWGSASALANRLFRSEPDLNPQPWMEAPLLARFLGAATAGALLCVGALAGRRALDGRKSLDGVGVTIAFALAASPFVASYHLVLLVVPVAAVVARLSGRALAVWLLGWAALGSSAMNVFREASSWWVPLAYARFLVVAGLALVVAWPWLNRRVIGVAIAVGLASGLLALTWTRKQETWPRIESARGYSMMRPHFCGGELRWLSPALNGRGLESRGDGPDCDPPEPGESGDVRVISKFTEGSWNLFLRPEDPARAGTRLTLSDANEVDPVITPDGCGVVFASDQGRGLGSTALYRLDLGPLIPSCERSEPGEVRRGSGPPG